MRVLREERIAGILLRLGCWARRISPDVPPIVAMKQSPIVDAGRKALHGSERR